MIIYTVVKSSEDELFLLKPRREMIILDLDPIGLA